MEELDLLIGDDKYGFPGIDLVDVGEGRETSAEELEPALARLGERLEDHMNVKFEELARQSDRIAGLYA